jgi:hypothetical protein
MVLSKGSSGSGVINKPKYTMSYERNTVDAIKNLFNSDINSIVSVQDTVTDSSLLINVAMVDWCQKSYLRGVLRVGKRES